MSTYAIGDVHGCFETLLALLSRLRFDAHRDRLWFVGDLVNRGPESLAVLRWVRALEDRATVVLGNHDLHLIARFHGLAPEKPRDTLAEILSARDAGELVEWLRRRPVFHQDGNWALVHAGLRPQWSCARAAALAREVESELRGEGMRSLLLEMREKLAIAWSEELDLPTRRRAALATFVLSRAVDENDVPVPRFSGPPREAPAGCAAWFARPSAREPGQTLLFGHWAALGRYRGHGVLGLDSGVAWGGPLSAVRLEDGALFEEENRDGMNPR